MGQISPCSIPAIAGWGLLEYRQRASQKHLPSDMTLDLAARCLRQSAGGNKNNFASRDVMFPADRLADRGDDLGNGDLPAIAALDLLDHHEMLAVILVEHAASGAAVGGAGGG